MTKISHMKRRLALGLVVAAALATVPAGGAGPQSFTFLQAGFTQELYGTTSNLLDTENGLLGGVAFRFSDPVVAECLFSGTQLHQYDSSTAAPIVNGTSSLHPEAIRSFAGDARGLGGCGLTNHPNGFIYSNLDPSNGAGQPGAGVAEIDPSTWTVSRYLGPAGSGLGIAVDPQSNHLVYVGQDCEQGAASQTCTLVDVDPVSGSAHAFMQVPSTTLGFVDGVYFDPTGTFVFLSARAPVTALTVLQASGAAASRTAVIVQQVPMTSEPDGVAFHADAPKFVVTNNNDGTMSRFDFAGDDYTKAPTTSVFASGGFRGDLTQVGPDGCIYATQLGTRYDDGTVTGENSVVRICGGFAPPPGVASQPPCTGTIGDFVWFDANGDGLQQSGEPGIRGVTLTLRSAADGSVLATTTSNAAGAYSFAGQCAGTYTVSAATPPGYAPTSSLVGGDRAVDSNGSPTTVVLSAANSVDTTIDFGFVLGSVRGTVYLDQNRNGVRDAGEPGLGGVPVALTGPTGGTVTTAADGTYAFALLPGGAYQAQAPGVASGWAIETTNPLAVALAAGQNRSGVDFGYVGGSISGFAYVDANRNGVRDAGEAGIGGVTVALSGASAGTTVTATDGSYAFATLVAGSYSVAAPASAAGLTRSTASPLSVTLAAGQVQPNVNFGYSETAAPTCTEQSWAGPPFHGTMTFQDTGGGIVSLTITKNVNFSATMPGVSGTILPPSPPNIVATFSPPTHAPLAVNATRIDATKSATLTVKAVDVFGNTISCDPIATTVVKLRHEKGAQTLTGIAAGDHVVTIENGTPGLRGLDVVVNGVVFEVRKLADRETRVVDVMSAMRAGNRNTIALVPRGRPGESAVVTISDR